MRMIVCVVTPSVCPTLVGVNPPRKTNQHFGPKFSIIKIMKHGTGLCMS